MSSSRVATVEDIVGVGVNVEGETVETTMVAIISALWVACGLMKSEWVW